MITCQSEKKPSRSVDFKRREIMFFGRDDDLLDAPLVDVDAIPAMSLYHPTNNDLVSRVTIDGQAVNSLKTDDNQIPVMTPTY
ncbi:hypothetical protein DPT39_25760 [Salmonella enterica subsp. enterica serovar Bere]|nr:hypothetical protein [Salmonella enterica subsp. enterica serovar Bere]